MTLFIYLFFGMTLNDQLTNGNTTIAKKKKKKKKNPPQQNYNSQ